MSINPLGNIKAENDHIMLDAAFYDTQEYNSLIEDSAHRIVIGRRGTGKSALFYRLQKHWGHEKKSNIIILSPGETYIIGIRFFINCFGDNPSYLRAACKILWEYAILNEIIINLVQEYKIKSETLLNDLNSFRSNWVKGGSNIASRLYFLLQNKLNIKEPAEVKIANLTRTLEISRVRNLVADSFKFSRYKYRIISDRLDEGYEPDDRGVAIISGLLSALDIVTSSIESVSSVTFLRDNIFRAVQRCDPDYSRNIEGDILRIHWDEYHLFNMICNRIRKSFKISREQNLVTWNKVTAKGVTGKEGFRKCLRQTLYRPRDLLVLLNNAFNSALSHKRNEIVDEDIELSAKDISCSRLDDLKKEYKSVLPGLEEIIKIFSGGSPKFIVLEANKLMQSLFDLDDVNSLARQTLAIMQSPSEVLRMLFSIGFIGILNKDSSCYVYCHDGKEPDVSIDEKANILIHPCYWIALNLHNVDLEEEIRDEIHDEYDIEVCSETPEIRSKKIGQLISELSLIDEGKEHASMFEDWCLKAIRIIFAKGIVNVELHPNKNLTQRRDVVGRNTGETNAWRRILNDFKVRQVIFEIKNYSKDLSGDEYRQMLSYLTNGYGKLGFIVKRGSDETLRKGKELRWAKEIYDKHDKRIVVKLTDSFIVRCLSKLRNPQKHDAPDKQLSSLLDNYQRRYLS
ncbi:MAG: ATP-binding protein [Candidatus Omnitrophica bacterium]|nr:ATP-binding protein [Candidatus Omnitrophota bacterium]